MLGFAEEFPSCQIGQQPADHLPWFHIVTLLKKVSSPKDREWCARATIEHGWSRNVLVQQIESGLMRRNSKSPKYSDGG
jgi:predicted nuclease of restriction endonuclease-like (RecB) superfamily